MFCSKCGSPDLAVCLQGRIGVEIPIRKTSGNLARVSDPEIRECLEQDAAHGSSLLDVELTELICRECYTTFTVPKWTWSAWLGETVDIA